MEIIKEEIEKHRHNWKTHDSKPKGASLQFKDEAEMYDLLSLVANDAFYNGMRGWANKHQCDEKFTKYWKQFTDNLKK